MAELALSRECAEGRHRPRRARVITENGMAQSTCRDCGCTLMRSQQMRRWYFSGTLGLDAQTTQAVQPASIKVSPLA